MDAKWYRLASYDSAVVSMPDGTSAALYQRDPDHFRDLLRRDVEIHRRLHREWSELAARYRQALGIDHLARGVGEDLRRLRRGAAREQRPGQQHPLQKERILSRGDRKRAAQRARQQAKRKADSMPAVDAMDGPREGACGRRRAGLAGTRRGSDRGTPGSPTCCG